jgi:hypothetical protein
MFVGFGKDTNRMADAGQYIDWLVFNGYCYSGTLSMLGSWYWMTTVKPLIFIAYMAKYCRICWTE